MKHAFDHLTAADVTFHEIVATYGYPTPQLRAPGFAAMVHIILEQQVSIASAKATYRKLELALESVTPEKSLAAPDEVFREAGVSRQKTAYIRDMAQRVVSGILYFESLSAKTEAEVRAELLQIKGVGHWSIDVYLMFCLQSEDILPLGDIAIVNTMKEFWPDLSAAEREAKAATWKPYRTAAAYLLWHHYLRSRGRFDM
ncbi:MULTISPECIES: DNA-3-methyladenine glycosylase [unclassified Flavobacterium]|uniref:DNA-3-methyladenine glycosylase family protein n=1 Tax=unclassified Flavobacterium TaxID=196869 RepID=UPI001F12FB5C|nr:MULTISPECIES: DNA-3-methyladenine glycosylase 2 family protein [unclassified Flavobacterium]UMY65906.1 DNA-3-methyladenine glycosylase 2 family protein [Flavobacterium sp. HJ-32-4]